MSQNILELVKNEIVDYETGSGKEAQEDGFDLCNAVRDFFSEDYPAANMGTAGGYAAAGMAGIMHGQMQRTMGDECQMAKKKKRPQGHYCKICGEYKANEKFSGKGHAVHICKSCSRLSAAEKAEAQTMNRLMGLPLRHLNQGDKKWLENRIHDSRPEVAGLAREIYRECFPYAERNAMKKQLVINELDFEIHTEVYQEYGDWEAVNQEFHIVRKERKITFQDLDRGGSEQEAALDGGSMAKLLRWIVHTLEIFMWPQDYGYVSPDGDPFMELNLEMGENDLADEEDFMEDTGLFWKPGEERERRSDWCVRVKYSNGIEQEIPCYDGELTDKPEELYFCILEYFEPVK